MAQKKQIALRKQELIAQLAESRHVIDQGRAAIKEKLNVKKQISTLVRRKPKAVFASSAVAGLVATLLLRRPRRAKKKASKPLTTVLFGWAMLAIKPAAKKWLTRKAKAVALAKLGSFSKPQQARLTAPRHEATPHIR